MGAPWNGSETGYTPYTPTIAPPPSNQAGSVRNQQGLIKPLKPMLGEMVKSFNSLKSPHGPNPTEAVLDVVELGAAVEALDPRAVTKVLGRTPVAGRRKSSFFIFM